MSKLRTVIAHIYRNPSGDEIVLGFCAGEAPDKAYGSDGVKLIRDEKREKELDEETREYMAYMEFMHDLE